MNAPRIAVHPTNAIPVEVDSATQAVKEGGGEVVDLDGKLDGLVVVPRAQAPHTPLAEVIAAHPELRWVQLPAAGVEGFVGSGVVTDERAWTCAKGSYAEPVAEHALLLALAGLRDIPARVRASTWGVQAGTSLYDQPVTILGGGGITEALVELLAPFRAKVTVVRRRPDPVPGAYRTMTVDALDESLPGALVVFVALSLTPETERIVGARQLRLMDRRAWLVNVARGRHVDTEALVAALGAGEIAGAALDVTDPEPLPDGHPLWSDPHCIITPHSADTWDIIRPMLAARIRANVAHFAAGEPLEGLIDPAAGY